MSGKILITGGAGFIGSHLADELVHAGYSVRVLDNLDAQVHGGRRRRPAYLHDEVELQVGDMRDFGAVRRALQGVSVVFHIAARVGVGQSMYELQEYVSVNTLGTAVLLEELARAPVDRLVVASSMSIYGEGLYRNGCGSPVPGTRRSFEQLRRGDWELVGAGGSPLSPLPTPESKPVDLESIYALSKYDQERMCLIAGRAYDIPTVALRFFNVYGSRQALSNPYTGVLAIFASRLLNDRPPLIFEDGLQQRDFVSVHDVARACRLVLESGVRGRSLNIGSGRGRTVLDVALALSDALGKKSIDPEISGRSRVGDIRHCVADISTARELIGYEPEVRFEDGLLDLCAWLRGQPAQDRVSIASAELHSRGLTIEANPLRVADGTPSRSPIDRESRHPARKGRTREPRGRQAGEAK